MSDPYHNVIFVHEKSKMPKGEHWAIIKFGSIHIPGDERSRTHPGHGYPERNEPSLEYRAFLNKADWEAAVGELAGEKHTSNDSWIAMRVNPVTATIKVEITEEPKPKPKTRVKCPFSKPWQGICDVLTAVGQEYCSEHLQEKCRCGKQATRGCDNAGQFVCGAPLCGSCYCSH